MTFSSRFSCLFDCFHWHLRFLWENLNLLVLFPTNQMIVRNHFHLVYFQFDMLDWKYFHQIYHEKLIGLKIPAIIFKFNFNNCQFTNCNTSRRMEHCTFLIFICTQQTSVDDIETSIWTRLNHSWKASIEIWCIALKCRKWFNWFQNGTTIQILQIDYCSKVFRSQTSIFH